MTNPYYTPSGSPTTGSFGASAVMRSEFALIASGFALLPQITGGSASGLTFPSGTDTVAGISLTQTLTNKTISGSSNTLSNIGNASLSNSSITIGSTNVALGGTAATIGGLTLATPALGTPASGVLTNCTGTAAGLTAGNVTTNANLTGPITSTGNATAVASQTGTGTKFVMDTSPTLVTPTLGAATATSINGLTITTSTGTLTVTNGKTLTASNSITLAGTDSTTMTFPSTSATIARTDAGNTFSGSQTITSSANAARTPLIIQNTNGGSSASTILALSNDGAGFGSLYMSSTTNTASFTTGGPTSAQLALAPDQVGMPLVFGSGAAIFAGMFDTSQRFLVGYNADQGGGQKLQVNGAGLFNGTLQFGTYTGTPVTSAGYITITDSAGNTRKLMVGT